MKARRKVEMMDERGVRLGCELCGSTIEKFSPFGLFADGDGDLHNICLECVQSGDGLEQRILEAAEKLERQTEEFVRNLRSLAGDTWVLPTGPELWARYVEPVPWDAAPRHLAAVRAEA